MAKFSSMAVKTAVTAALLGSVSVAFAQSGNSGGSGSAGATIDTGFGASAAGAGASNNPGLALPGNEGVILTGPIGLIFEVFSFSFSGEVDEPSITFDGSSATGAATLR